MFPGPRAHDSRDAELPRVEERPHPMERFQSGPQHMQAAQDGVLRAESQSTSASSTIIITHRCEHTTHTPGPWMVEGLLPELSRETRPCPLPFPALCPRAPLIGRPMVGLGVKQAFVLLASGCSLVPAQLVRGHVPRSAQSLGPARFAGTQDGSWPRLHAPVHPHHRTRTPVSHPPSSHLHAPPHSIVHTHHHHSCRSSPL
ncbi:hypothetical protein DFH27DRAFT_646043 [Peziza echinospora]|nr:hypothetical protein DFH27DRAFT_646043 [Peziza echinospora]